MTSHKVLLIKNIPRNFDNINEYLTKSFGANLIKSYGRRRLIVHFPDEPTAVRALQNLHQRQLGNSILSVEFLGNRKLADDDADKEDYDVPVQENSNENNELVTKFVKSLYATSTKYCFEQPPPPHLKYNYPKINRTILDSISIALLTIPKFYYQVLHLMNRMNLEPPFLPLKKPFIPPGEPKDAETQTEFLRSQKYLLASDESEIESDEEENINFQRNVQKRKNEEDRNELKKKARKILVSCLSEKTISTNLGKDKPVPNMFENSDVKIGVPKISLNISSVRLPEEKAVEIRVDTQSCISEADDEKKTLSLDDIRSNRFSEIQMKDLPFFKNYKKGEISNKLYIKNLNKDVSEDDLMAIYGRYANNSNKTIDIKLMKFGKMKGQAFITFNDITEDKLDIIENALNETNGYILKNKPMVVCFGKK